LTEIVAGLNDLKARAEVAVKSGALLLVLGGDCAQVIGLLTGARRYYKRLSLLWLDRDADLNTPATTPSGRIDGMVVAHIIGKGAPELVRFFGEPPLVREPDVTLFGLERIDAPEQEFLDKSPMRRKLASDVKAKGGADSARATLAQMHADARQVILHVDLDVIAQEEFPAVNVPGSGGLSFSDVRGALVEIVKNPNLLGLDVAQYNPDKDADGSGAKKVVDVLVEALTARLAESEASGAAPAEDAAGGATTGALDTTGTFAQNEAAAPEITLQEAPTDEVAPGEDASHEIAHNVGENEPASGEVGENTRDEAQKETSA
jgi:arginase